MELDPTNSAAANNAEPIPETPEAIEQDVPKQGMSGFLKFILAILGIFIVVVGGGAGYVWYMNQNAPQPKQWEQVEEEPVKPSNTNVGVRNSAQQTQPPAEVKQPSVFKATPSPVESQQPSVFKAPSTTDNSTVERPKLQLPQVGDVMDSLKRQSVTDEATQANPEPLTEMEKFASTQSDESMVGSHEDSHGHLSLGEDDLHESVLAEMKLIREEQKQHEDRFKSFDLAATALHRAHKDQIDAIASNQARTDKTLVSIQGQLISVKSQLEKGLNTEEMAGALKKVADTKKSVDKLVAQSKQNDRNIKWMSRERMCYLEAQIGITKYSKQCAEFLKRSKPKTPLAIRSVKPVQAPSAARVMSSSPEVPATVGVVPNPQPVANATMLASNRPSNPCEFADRTWKLQLISGNNALLSRRTDGYESVVEENSSVPGLGRAQLFNATGYPQYVQFTNGIVCGG